MADGSPKARRVAHLGDQVPNLSTAPVDIKDASTVVVGRRTSSGFAVLLVERPGTSKFAPGAYVFPGGSVGRADWLADQALGMPTPRLPKAGMTDPDGTPPRVLELAAVRELFEEAGILLARNSRGRLAKDSDSQRLLGEVTSNGTWAQAMANLGLTPDLDRLTFFARWVTPAGMPRRFDTRFFLATMPSGQQVHLATSELSSHLWLTPKAALEMNQAGGLHLVFATQTILAELAGADQLSALMRKLRRRTAVTKVAPVLAATANGWQVSY